MGQIVPLKKQGYDEFSLLSREELLTLLSGACMLSSWNFTAAVFWLNIMPGRVPDEVLDTSLFSHLDIFYSSANYSKNLTADFGVHSVKTARLMVEWQNDSPNRCEEWFSVGLFHVTKSVLDLSWTVCAFVCAGTEYTQWMRVWVCAHTVCAHVRSRLYVWLLHFKAKPPDFPWASGRVSPITDSFLRFPRRLCLCSCSLRSSPLTQGGVKFMLFIC